MESGLLMWSMRMDTPQSTVLAILKEHVKWQKQLETSCTPEYFKYKSINLEIIITTITTLPCRSKLKQEATHGHEKEKDYMVTLQAAGITTSSYSADTGLSKITRIGLNVMKSQVTPSHL